HAARALQIKPCPVDRSTRWSALTPNAPGSRRLHRDDVETNASHHIGPWLRLYLKCSIQTADEQRRDHVIHRPQVLAPDHPKPKAPGIPKNAPHGPAPSSRPIAYTQPEITNDPIQLGLPDWMGSRGLRPVSLPHHRT